VRLLPRSHRGRPARSSCQLRILAIPVLLLVLHGPIATNILNIYSCSLCAQTLDWKLNRRKIALSSAIALAFTIVLSSRTTSPALWTAGCPDCDVGSPVGGVT